MMKTAAIENLVMIKGIPFPEGEKFRQIIVSGPPGSGKTTLVEKLGGWSEEGYLDLAQDHWWRNQILTFRPREVHFGFPFKGHQESFAVFDKEWLASPTGIEFERIKIPPEGKGFFVTDWRRKYVFDFLIPPAELIYAIRAEREGKATHLIDHDVSLEQVKLQVAVYWDLALYFHRKGMKVQIRESFEGAPRQIVDS